MTLSKYDHSVAFGLSDVTIDTVNEIGSQRDDFYDFLTVEHDSTGGHDTEKVPRGWVIVEDPSDVSDGTSCDILQKTGVITDVVKINTGDYTIDFSPNDMGDTNYHVYVMVVDSSDTPFVAEVIDLDKSTTDVRVTIENKTTDLDADAPFVVIVTGVAAVS